MATAMTAAQKNSAIKNDIMAILSDALTAAGAIQTGDYTYAVPTTVDGETRYGEVTLTAKNNKATKTTDAYDPIAKREDWETTKEIKLKEASAKAAKKAADEKKRAEKKSKAAVEKDEAAE